MVAKARRQREVARLIQSQHVTSQSELVDLLSRRGIAVTQATLSRDLAELGVVKGASGYQLLDATAAPTDRAAALASAVRRMLLGAQSGGTIAVLHTAPGQAAALAVEIDRAEPEGALGTIAGDDCIFVACTSPASARQLAAQLMELSAGAVRA